VFGEGERLRFDLQGGLAPTVISGGFFSLPPIDAANLIGSAKMSFVKPALYGSRDDLLVDTAAVRERTQYYWANYGNASVGIIPTLADQNPCAQSRNPRDMMRHGCSTSLFHASQQ
jgi:translocation and assembly module TamA